jgi:peroxiredoxin
MRTRPLSESRLRRDGLDAGTPAPDFTLPDLTGRQHSLSEFRGRRLLLVFSDPGCGPCQMLAPKLEEIHRRRDIAGLHVLMVSRGGVPANREKAREHGLTFPVLLQNAWEISREYAMFATPIAYLIDETGTIASGAAVGVEPILALARPLDARADTLVGVSA